MRGHLFAKSAQVSSRWVRHAAAKAILKPAGYDSRWHGEVPWHVRIALPADSLLDVAYARGMADRVNVQLRNEFRLSDRFVGDVALLLRSELRRAAHPAQTLIADGLALALAGHLFGHYSSVRDPPPAKAPSGTRPAVRRALEYLHAHPTARHSLEDLALAAGLSKHHLPGRFGRRRARLRAFTSNGYVSSKPNGSCAAIPMRRWRRSPTNSGSPITVTSPVAFVNTLAVLRARSETRRRENLR